MSDATPTPMFRTLRYEVADRKAYITLDRPDRLNAIDPHMPGEIHAAVDLANDDPEVHPPPGPPAVHRRAVGFA